MNNKTNNYDATIVDSNLCQGCAKIILQVFPR